MLALALTLIFAPPSQPADANAEAPAASAQDGPAAAEDGYTVEQARADVELILVDRGKDYLAARGRLEEHPTQAAAAVLERLEAVPAPGPDQRNRLLNVLAVLGQAEHVEMFGEQLRNAMIHKRPTELWLQLLRKQGAAATATLIELVGDRELSNEDRGDLLDLLVELTAREGLGELMAMVGRGSEDLQDRLRRALIRRSRHDDEDSQAIATGIDEDLDEDVATEDPKTSGRIAQLLILRAACCTPDELFSARLEQLAGDESSPFEVRVAAIDGLRRLGIGQPVLETIIRAQAQAALQGAQAAEVLVSLALEALPESSAEALSSELGLVDAPAPRLAALGYRFAKLEGDWLAHSQEHPWPEVRKAALDRVAAKQAGCDKTRTRELADIAGPVSAGGDDDARVGRAAVAALGRCADEPAFKALRALVEDTGVDITQRAEAARQLVLHDPEGPDYAADLLVDGRYLDLARELADALGSSPTPTDKVRDALCRASAGNPMVASTAHDSFTRLFPGQRCE